MAKKATKKAETADETRIQPEEITQLQSQRVEEIIRDANGDHDNQVKACLFWDSTFRPNHAQNGPVPIMQLVVKVLVKEIKRRPEFANWEQTDIEELVERSRSAKATTSKAANKKKRPKK